MTDAEFLGTDFEILRAAMSLDEINARLTTIITTALSEVPSVDARRLKPITKAPHALRCLSCLPDETFDGWNPPGSTHCLRCYMPLNSRNARTSKEPERFGEVLGRSLSAQRGGR
jgi:hypothetical protein